MCGRFSFALDMGVLVERFNLRVIDFPFEPRFNIAPTQQVVTVVVEEGGNRAGLMHWGLIPSWAKDPAIGNRMINARAETVAERNSFRQAFQKRRCLVVADGFYEWRKTPRGKVPMRILLKDGSPFAFAGLWETWRPPQGDPVHSCTIVTTTPNSLMEPIHDRMPVILTREGESSWLDRKAESSELRALLVPYPANEMDAYEVSTLVNSPKNDSPEVITRLP